MKSSRDDFAYSLIADLRGELSAAGVALPEGVAVVARSVAYTMFARERLLRDRIKRLESLAGRVVEVSDGGKD
jgi:hypothetical protein